MDRLSGDITRDTASTLRNYLLYELKITELTPELVLPRLNKKFLEAQPDAWILRLDQLGGQSALVRQGRVGNIPRGRLEDGTHVVADERSTTAILPSTIRPISRPSRNRCAAQRSPWSFSRHWD